MDLYQASLGEESEEEITLTLEEYEDAKVHYQAIIDRGEAAKRLAENPDFNLLVMDGFFVAEPKRLAELMASGRLNSTTMEACKNELAGIGVFRNYMKMHTEQGNQAKEALVMLEEARHEAILAEEAANTSAG